MFIIILGGANDVSGNLASFTLERINIFYTIFESLKKDNPKVILSGGYRFSKVSHCELVKKNLMKGPDIQIEKEFIENNNTVDEAINIAHYFNDINYRGQIIIITSSWHIPRAQYLFNTTFADMTDIELIWKATAERNIDLEVIEKRKLEQIMNHSFGKWAKFIENHGTN